MQTLHEGFGRNFGAALSALLRTIVEVKLTSVDQLTYSEFVFSLENPTCFNLLRRSRWRATSFSTSTPRSSIPSSTACWAGAARADRWPGGR